MPTQALIICIWEFCSVIIGHFMTSVFALHTIILGVMKKYSEALGPVFMLQLHLWLFEHLKSIHFEPLHDNSKVR